MPRGSFLCSYKLKIALIGTGNRGSGTYLPIIKILKDDVELVAVCDEHEDVVTERGEQYGVPAFTDTEKMLNAVKPDVCAIVITPSNNHIPGIICSEHGVSYVTETPIDTDLGWADRMIESAEANGTKIEIAENYYRGPNERIKRFRDKAIILNEDADERRPINITRKTNEVDGREILAALIADTEPEVVWENPLRNYPLSNGQISVASEIMSIVNAVRNNTEPEYGPYNGRKDREIDVGMMRSWSNNSEPVTFPFEYESC